MLINKATLLSAGSDLPSYCSAKMFYLVFREVLVVLDEVCQDLLSLPSVLSFLQ